MTKHTLSWPVGLGLLLAATLTTPSLAAPQVYAEDPVLHPHPAGFMPGNAREVVTGQLTNDADPDVAILQGTSIVLLHAAARHDAFLKLPGSFEELALLPGGGLAGKDSLLAIDASGLVEVQWSGSALVQDPQFPPQSAWIGARSLQVAPISDGTFHVSALKAEGNQILRGAWGGGSFTNDLPFDPQGSPLTFTALEFDTGHSGLEYAVDSGTGLKVLSSTGSTIASISNPASAPLVRRLPELGTLEEAIVWLTAVPGSNDQVQMLGVVRMGISSAYSEPYLPLPGVRVADILLADYFGHGRLDLIGLAHTDTQVRVFKNQWGNNPQPTYTFYLPPPGETFLLDGSAVNVGGSGLPALGAGDLDGDGDADLVLAGHQLGSKNIGVYLSDGVDEDFYRPQLLDCTEYVEDLPTNGMILASLAFTLSSPDISTEATHIRVAVWIQPDEQSPVAATAAYNQTFPIPPGGFPSGFAIQAPLIVVAQGHQIFHAQAWAIREVGGTTVQAWPATTWWKPRQSIQQDPLCREDPGSTGGYNEPPNIQPGGTGTRTP